MSQLSQFLKERITSNGSSHEQDPTRLPWWQKGITVEVNEAKYLGYLELLPPQYLPGSLFAFGKGSDNFILLWIAAGRHYADHLSQADTERFCELVGLSLLQ